jgi:hypothetical protein
LKRDFTSVILLRQNRRIHLSDEEEEIEEVEVPLYGKSSSRGALCKEDIDGWLEVRNVAQISKVERQHNIQAAQLERKHRPWTSSQKTLSGIVNSIGIKSSPTHEGNNYIINSTNQIKKREKIIQEDEEFIAEPTPEKFKPPLSKILRQSQFSSSLIQDTMDSEKDRKIAMLRAEREELRKRTREIRLQERQNKLQSAVDPIPETKRPRLIELETEESFQDILKDARSLAPKKNKIAVKSSDEDNGDDVDSEDSFGEEDMDDKARRNAAERLLQTCESLSASLRDSLRLWESRDSSSEAGGGERDCVDLTAISDLAQAKSPRNTFSETKTSWSSVLVYC